MNCAKKSFIGNYYFFFLLLVTLLGKLAVVIPRFPRGGLDPSWVFGLSVASSDHFVFGRDIIYTFGPLSSVDTGSWIPDLHALTVIFSILIALSLAIFSFKIFEKSSYLVKFLLVLFLFVNIWNAPDFFYSLLPAAAALTLINSYVNNRGAYFIFVTMFGFIAALLLLVKLSFGAESSACLVVLLVFYIIKKDLKSCLVLIAAFLSSFVLLYLLSGQKLQNIIYYPVNIYYGIAGYSDAMASPGPLPPVIASAVFLILLITYYAYYSIRSFNINGIFSVLVISLLSLVVFKHGYVRNDFGHSADVYLLQCFLLIYILHAIKAPAARNFLLTAGVVSLLVFGAINEPFFISGHQIKNSYIGLITQANSVGRIFNNSQNEVDFEKSVEKISNDSPLPAMDGTSDIYNYNQSVLLASDNKWNPRPAFQSYQAVTPYLANANYKHLVNKETAPDNIFFSLETIDGRFPSMDDGLSWKALLGLYKPEGWTENKDYLILKRDDIYGKELRVKDSRSLTGKTGQEIANPYENGLVFFKMHQKKSIIGTLLSIVYKTDPVRIKLMLQNGQYRIFRIIPSMSETGFLLSPLSESTLDFYYLYMSRYYMNSDFGLKVKSITINPESQYQYSNSFDVVFEQLEYPNMPDAVAGKLKRTNIDVRKTASDSSVKYNVDAFSYQFADNKKLVLGLRGWAFKKNVDITDSSYSLIFAGPDSESFELPLEGVKRLDVSDYFGHGHNYDMCGYISEGVFDASELRSKVEYNLYLRMVINKTEYVFSVDKSLKIN